MPPRPLKVCRHAGCHELTRDPSGYCPKHKDAAEARARKWKAEQDSQRESAYRRGYGARWRKLRAQILMDEPLCRECRKAGRIVRRMLTTSWPEPTAGRMTGATCNPSVMPATAGRPSGRTAGVR